MLHLDARVRLEEDVPRCRSARRPGRDQELDCAGAPVAHRTSDGERVREEPLAQRARQVASRAGLDLLLPPPLHGAVALVQVDNLRPVAEQLHLDVPRRRQELLDEDTAEQADRRTLALARRKRLVERFVARHRPHAAPAAAAHRLEHHWVVDPSAGHCRTHARRAVARRRAPCRGWHSKLLRQLARRDLVAELPNRRGCRPDKGDARLITSVGEASRLGKEAVSRMEHVAAGFGGRADDPVRVKVRRHRKRLASQRHMQRGLVGRLVHRDRPHVKLRGRAQDPNRNFAAVGH